MNHETNADQLANGTAESAFRDARDMYQIPRRHEVQTIDGHIGIRKQATEQVSRLERQVAPLEDVDKVRSAQVSFWHGLLLHNDAAVTGVEPILGA